MKMSGAVVEFIADAVIACKSGKEKESLWTSIRYSLDLSKGGDVLIWLDSAIRETRPEPMKHYDDYLLPILDNDAIESLVAEMYRSCYQGNWDLSSKPRLGDLCERLGASQVFVDLPDAPDVFGITFFRDSEIEVKEGRKREIRKYNEGTLLLTNRYPKYSRGAQFFAFGHELAHWCFHRAAYEFARIAGGLTDFGIICEGNDINNLYSVIASKVERQADSIGAVICAPGPYIERLVSERLIGSERPIESLTADELQGMAQEIAQETGLSKKAATIRLREQGYRWDKGINLYVDGRWLDPVNVASLSLAWDETISITEKQFLDLVAESEHLFEGIICWRFVYADSHVVINVPQYVLFSQTEGFHVTAYAREHPEECMLRFRVQSSGLHIGSSGLYSDRLYKRWLPRAEQEIHYEAADNIDVEKKVEDLDFWDHEAERLNMFIDDTSFARSLDRLMTETKTTNQYLADLLGFGDAKTIQRYRHETNAKKGPDRRFVISVCFALRLPYRCACSLLETCGYSFSMRNQQDRRCAVLLAEHVGYENAKTVLRKSGFDILL